MPLNAYIYNKAWQIFLWQSMIAKYKANYSDIVCKICKIRKLG